MKKKRKKVPTPHIVERKLGQEQAWGIAHYHPDDKFKTPTIEIDTRLSPKRQLEVFCHEALHIALPHLCPEGNSKEIKAQNKRGEKEIDRLGKAVCAVIWKANYRRVVLTKHTTPVRIIKK